jgi:hypothetical protein
MKLHKPLCPDCGEPAHGTVERLAGYAQFVGEPGPETSVEYSGWTEIWWDEQHTVHQKDDRNVPEGPDNLPLVCCPNGHTWPTAIDW